MTRLVQPVPAADVTAASPDSAQSDTLLPRAPPRATPWQARGATDVTSASVTDDAETKTPPAAATRVARRREYPDIPGYEILGELGRGGMGVVYRARQTRLNRTVALKMIRGGDDAGPDELARFRREAEAVAHLRHPNIVQIYEVGDVQGAPFFSLEYVDGGSLAGKLRGVPQPPRQAARMSETLARAVHHAHERGVIHRDLKPANILLDSDGAPKVTDFGLAKRLEGDPGQTGTGAILGTPMYMSPEQAQGKTKEVGPATDVYALGAILYDMLTGRPPFRGETVMDTLLQVQTVEPVPCRRLQPGVPADLETICLKALAKSAPRRYPSAEAMADDLARFLNGEAIRARPVAAWERAWKWARRRPALAALTAACVLALVGGATGGVFYGLYKDQQAAALGKRLEHRRAVDDLWDLGQKAEAAGRLDAAKEHWDRALATLDSDPGAAGEEMRLRLIAGLDRVRGLLEEQAEGRARLVARQKFEDGRKRFESHRDQVLFHAVSSRAGEAAEDAAAVRREAAGAMAQLGLDAADPPSLAAGVESLRGLAESPAQFTRLADECAEVLRLWAEAEEDPPGSDGPGRSRQLLAAAAALREVGGTARTTVLDHFKAALASYRADRLEEAQAACEECLQLRPDHFWAQYVKALCNLRAKRWGEAKVGLTVCLGRRPDYPWLLPLRGMAHGGLKEYEAAEADFARALDESTDPVVRVAALTNRSAVRLQRGRRADAERDLRQAIELRPDAYQGYVNLARALEAGGDRDGAVKLLDRALELSPESPALYSLRARVHAERGDREAARRDFEQVIAKEPAGGTSERGVTARVELAHLRHLAGEDAAALADCDAALKMRPDFPEAHRQRAEVLLALGRDDEAGAALDRYLAAGGESSARVFQARGLLHAKRREYGAAVEAYTRALVLHRDAETLSYRGWAYLMQEAARPALDDFDAALKLDARHADALAGRGTALVLRGRVADLADATRAAEESLRGGAATVPRLMACARVHARAAGVLDAARGRAADDARAEGYRQRALALLRETMARVPEKERPAFWRGVLADPALTSLQRTAGMAELARSYAG
ncbi:MAG TPA: protein kinase [Gemmataceae bacterium]|nr:protein kinase [Gemmataceae bacterium]